MIDEFSDVNEGEKEFMKMWNVHVQVIQVTTIFFPPTLKYFFNNYSECLKSELV